MLKVPCVLILEGSGNSGFRILIRTTITPSSQDNPTRKLRDCLERQPHSHV
jgi:hypothetical protein